jgi:Cu2+-exporting ATPase
MTPETNQPSVVAPALQRLWMALLTLLVLAFIGLAVFGSGFQAIAAVFVAVALAALGRKALTVGDSWQYVNAERAFFERFAATDVVVLPKSGALTDTGRWLMAKQSFVSSLGDQDLLLLAAAVEQHSDHPLAGAILARLNASDELAEARDFRAIPGVGVTAMVGGQAVTIGGPTLLTSRNLFLTVDQLVRVTAEHAEGRTVLFMVRDNELLGFFAIAHNISESASRAVDLLHKFKKRIVVLSADAEDVVKWVAEHFDIDEVYAEVMPHQRASVFEKLAAGGKTVAVVGEEFLPQADGVPVLAKDLDSLAVAIERGMKLRRVLGQNLVIAGVLELLALPLALGAFASIGATFEIVLGSLLISLSAATAAWQTRKLKR